jgi:hypothetical protein
MNFGPGTPVPSRPFNSAQPRRQQQRDLNNQHSLFPFTTITAIEIPQTDRQTATHSRPACLIYGNPLHFSVIMIFCRELLASY